MTDHTIEWSPAANLNTDAVTIITTAERLEQRRRKTTEFVPLAQKLDAATWEQLKQLANGGAGDA